MKLFHVTTTAHEYCGCRNVVFRWFRQGSSGRPYANLIQDFVGGDPYAEGCIDEMFTEQEYQDLKDYLDREHGDAGVTAVTRAEIPIPNNLMPLGAIAVGGGDDFYTLDKEPNYSLPFGVWGYFD